MVNPWLFRLKERTLQYRFQVKYLPGKRNTAADFLSKNPTLRSPSTDADADLDEDLAEAVTAAMTATAEYESHILDKSVVRKFAANDPVYQLLLAKVLATNWHQHKGRFQEQLVVAQSGTSASESHGSVSRRHFWSWSARRGVV